MNTAAIIALIGSLVPVINTLIGFLDRARETLKRSTELTPEEDRALDGYIDAIDRPVWWKHDAAPKGEPGTTP